MGATVLSLDETKTASARQRLEEVVRRIAVGNDQFRFALLRDSPVDSGLIDHGDADLLGTRESVTALLRMLLERALAGEVHFRVTANKPEKLQLSVFSTDLAHSATYDLWVDLAQIHEGRSLIRFEDVAPLLSQSSGIEPLPPCIAGALYLQHLIAKRKPLTAAHTSSRIESFATHHCSDSSCGVARWFRDILRVGRIRPPAPSEAAIQIERLLQIRLDDERHRATSRWRLRRKIESGDAVCIQGVDGVGKSTLISALVEEGTAASESLIGKKLYRRSLIYRMATRTARHRASNAREAIDERLATIVFLRAVSAFRRTLAWRRLRGAGTLLVDRSPLDFLYLGRKSDHGRFHPAIGRLESLAPSTPTIQLVAPHTVTSARKPELTEAGHVAYDDAMLLRIAGQSPCDHLVFHNGGNVSESSIALAAYLTRFIRTRGRKQAA
ncbi:hypothetical protein Pan44_25550 [Caulifigura coniformis]|uniref:Uncharacterized protein n=1 Tax=Caulifigura coniformis TaxID=2527983 RepID=A0A517SEH2_9PLAN|nr:hypothetical protein [Caulifigura coniformis]QDT54522.1 hypothetical protein Pan44_25550 [Caulifigura coniformis]